MLKVVRVVLFCDCRPLNVLNEITNSLTILKFHKFVIHKFVKFN